MNQDGGSTEKSGSELTGLDAHDNARALVRLIQCKKCSKPFRTPVSLPCGGSVCRQCLPEPHERQGITYPSLPEQRKTITCPLPGCGEEHPASNCSIDVTLTKVMENIEEVVVKHRSMNCPTPCRVQLDHVPDEAVSFEGSSEKPRVVELPWSKLVATYVLAAQGDLPYVPDLYYLNSDSENQIHRVLDVAIMQDLVEAAHRELDCQVCYNIMLDPVTTFCGHTLCRKCMARVVDHACQCPMCRRRSAIPPFLDRYPTNKALHDLIENICPDAMASRREAVAMEERGEGGLDVPLFICTLAFPGQPTFLRIFEPRYRLMLRRCLEGNREFGMLMYNRYNEPQGDLGHVHFWRYGTMLRIGLVQPLPDGTSLVETTGSYRFRVRAHGVRDGYAVGAVERIDDVPMDEEQRIEADETSRPAPEGGDPNAIADLERMSTDDLFRISTTFVARMRERSAHWLAQRVLDSHGHPPNDPATFPFWFAAVLPFVEEEKYKLLGIRTVRERLKVTATWIKHRVAEMVPVEFLQGLMTIFIALRRSGCLSDAGDAVSLAERPAQTRGRRVRRPFSMVRDKYWVWTSGTCARSGGHARGVTNWERTTTPATKYYMISPKLLARSRRICE